MIVLLGALSGPVQATVSEQSEQQPSALESLKHQVSNLANRMKIIEQKIENISNMLSANTVWFPCSTYLLDHKDRRSLIEIKMVRSLSQQSAEQQVLKEYPDNGNDSPRMTVDCSPIRDLYR